MYGICANAADVSSPPSTEAVSMFGFLIHELTITRPVIRHTTTVSQNVPVDEISA